MRLFWEHPYPSKDWEPWGGQLYTGSKRAPLGGLWSFSASLEDFGQSRVKKRFLERRSIFSSEEAFSREKKCFL